MWQDFLAAMCLVVVVEGILRFIRPTSWRRMVFIIAEQSDRALRLMGLLSMLAGVTLLYVVR